VSDGVPRSRTRPAAIPRARHVLIELLHAPQRLRLSERRCR
jgi:hypothetical protein